MNPSLFFAMHVWAMDAGQLSSLRSRCDGFVRLLAMGLTEGERFKAVLEGTPAIAVKRVKRKATVFLQGPLIHDPPDFLKAFTACTDLRDAATVISELGDDEDIDEIDLAISSPGGTCQGTFEVIDAIKVAKGKGKAMSCHGSGVLASAAYLIACACDKITVTRGTLVGSIGVYSILEDSTEADAKEGYKYTMVGSGGMKGIGADGKVTPELIAETKRYVDNWFAVMCSTVGEHRGMEPAAVAAIATGQAWLAPEAKAMDLVDDVTGIEDAVDGEDSQKDLDDGETATSKVAAQASTVSLQQAQGKNTMKIAAVALLALIDANPTHAALISAEAKADHDEPTILAAIAKANDEAAKAALTAAQAKATDLQAKLDASATASAAEKAKLTEAQAQIARLTALGKAPGDPGPLGGNANEGAPKTEDVLRAEFKASKELQDNWAIGGIEAYIFAKKEEEKAKSKGK